MCPRENPFPSVTFYKFLLDQALDFAENFPLRFHTILPGGLESTRAEGLRNRS
jgi:hypothetical protein